MTNKIDVIVAGLFCLGMALFTGGAAWAIEDWALTAGTIAAMAIGLGLTTLAIRLQNAARYYEEDYYDSY